jgi:hypothetical protein
MWFTENLIFTIMSKVKKEELVKMTNEEIAEKFNLDLEKVNCAFLNYNQLLDYLHSLEVPQEEMIALFQIATEVEGKSDFGPILSMRAFQYGKLNKSIGELATINRANIGLITTIVDILPEFNLNNFKKKVAEETKMAQDQKKKNPCNCKDQHDGGEIDTPDDNPESVPVDDGEDSGCIRCIKPPTIKGGLRAQSTDDSPILLQPCGGSWKEQIQYRIDWKNEDDETVGLNEDYKKTPGDTVAFKSVEVLDELTAIVKKAAGTVITLPQIISQKGINGVDNVLREFDKSLDIFLNGKSDLDLLRGEVRWNFELKEDSTISIKHIHQIDGFAQNSGLWDFNVKIATEESDLVSLNLLSEENKEEIAGLSKEKGVKKTTDGKKFFRAESSDSLSAGKHTIVSSIKLTAGYDGLVNKELKEQIEKVVLAIKKAVGSLTQAAVKVLQSIASGSTQAAVSQLQQVVKDSADVAAQAFGAILQLLINLLEEAIGYVKLHRSILRLSCTKQK